MSYPLDTANKLLLAFELSNSEGGHRGAAGKIDHILSGINKEDFSDKPRALLDSIAEMSQAIQDGTASEKDVDEYACLVRDLFEACRPNLNVAPGAK
ncbi:hypothetical protein [Pseudomonas sp. E102]|uniref:hypothetical protein n=1 Tax=Pseudomonas sp. E102 TaxID=181579 RepID=UPI0040463BFE